MLRAAAVIAIAGVLAGPAAAIAVGHSQLVASIPAAGDVVQTPPAAIRLTFSEPIDGSQTSLDVLSGTGAVLASGIGRVDPTDAYTLIAQPPSLSTGTYTINWRALSAADGHSTAGTFTFGVGDVSPPPLAASGAGAGSIHAGHDEGTVFLETESLIVGDLGLLVAAGLPWIAVLVLRRPGSAGIARVGAIGLFGGTLGAFGLLLLGGPASGISLGAYVATRTGGLDLVRLVITLLAGFVAWLLSGRRPRAALAVVAVAAAAGLVLVALDSHAAAFGDPAPLVAIVVHLLAAACWLTGVLALAWLVVLPEHRADDLGALVPRFSGVAIVAVGLISATGIYADWLQTGSLLSFDTPYQAALMVKIGLTVAALAIGWFNYRAAGRDRRFGPRVAAESALALGVVVATGVLVSGSPPGPAAPIEIARVSSSALDQGNARLTVSPGRPGPTQFTVTLPAPPPAGGRAELDLTRLDEPGDTTLALRGSADGLTWVAPGGLLPPNSRFDAAAIVRNGAGVEQSRSRFSFALGTEGIVAGRAEPVIDPILVVLLLLVGAAVVAVVLLIAGRTLPATDRRVGRVAMAVGSAVSAVLAVVIARGGLHP